MTTMKVVTMKQDIILGQQPLVVEVSVPTSEIPHPNGDQKTRNTQNVTHKTPMNRLFRQGDKNKTSRKHNEIVTEFEREPQAATYTFIAQETRKKRMRPMTSENRHDANRALYCWGATLGDIKEILNIDYPDEMYGYVSTANPLDDTFDLQLPTAKMPLQYGSKRKPAQYTHHKTFILRGRRKKAVMQTIFTQNAPLSLQDYYELAIGVLDNMYIASGAPKENLQQEWNRIQRQLQKQRFDDCMNSVYYSKTRKR